MFYNTAYARGVLQAAQRVNDRRELSLCSGRAAARHGCEHKTCYKICGGVVATEARAQAPIASTARAARSGRRAGLGAKFRPSSDMARFRFGPFSPVLDGRFIALNTFVLRNNKNGPYSDGSRALHGPFFVLDNNKKGPRSGGSRSLQGPFFVLDTSLSSAVPGYNSASHRCKQAQTTRRSTVSRTPPAAAESSSGTRASNPRS